MTTNERIRDAQAAYMTADLTGASADWDTYEALVQEVAWAFEVPIAEAFQIVEHGPCIF